MLLRRTGRFASGARSPTWTGLAVAMAAVVLVAGCRTVRGAGDEFTPPGAPPPSIRPDDVARMVIDLRRIDRGVEFLASDALRGRATPSPGLERAAAWVAAALQRAGLEPVGQDGGYIQYWPGPPDSTGAASRAPNIAALLPAGDTVETREPVVLTAHVDHRGVGPPGEDDDSVFNGAAAAAGVVVLIEVARALTALPDRPARPILFLVFSGTELGRRGSSWYVEHPTVDVSRPAAVLNLAELGRGADPTVRVVGEGRAEIAALLTRVSGEKGLGIPVTAATGASTGNALDHVSFEGPGVLSVSLIGGPDDQTGTVNDESGGIDEDRLARIARLLFYAVLRIAEDDVQAST